MQKSLKESSACPGIATKNYTGYAKMPKAIILHWTATASWPTIAWHGTPAWRASVPMFIAGTCLGLPALWTLE